MGMARSWTGRGSARAGVAGNPSDALGGAALAVPVHGLSATVVLRDAPRLTVRPIGGDRGWGSVPDLVDASARVGHDGAERLVTAAIVTLHRWLDDQDRRPDPSPFAVEWSTEIPRSVGLAGSSALVVATLRALCARWEVALAPEDLARLALAAEVDELGIAAGWMDRAVQAHDEPTFVDCRSMSPDGVPAMRVVAPGEPIELVAAWDPHGASPSGRLHRSLRARWASGEDEVVRCVDELVGSAQRAASALAAADLAALAEAVAASCALRDRLGALDAATRALVTAAGDAGGSATSAGSGGAVLIVPVGCSATALVAALADRGVPTAPVVLGPAGRSSADPD
jgi:glucuronokinase